MAAVWDGAFCVCFLPSVYLRLFANSLIWIFATALSASVQRSLFMLATSMLLFAAKIYQITELAAFLKLSIPVDVSLCYYSLIRYPTNIHSEACITYCVGKCELCLMFLIYWCRTLCICYYLETMEMITTVAGNSYSTFFMIIYILYLAG